ncbi:TPA: recombination protein NinG [Kluyvera intermedia]|uniref:Protein ninG n=2 Tax=Enterobacteriaceae TaxID=543 RepID=A0AAC8QQR4_9ENTR|nr:recombination protein NinG [Phytobacter ursingii]HAT2207119.1 recombination protein NinG [Kluyvera intermedia]AKL13289.1 protein ninG [Phytobacter ursingii]HAT2517811.1 recombination protein NinG [Kluyvera intermedia]HAT2605946.1 recombination protein NinG [Kluyvera intermedia]HAT2607111.1 recombination protein NinG [Kluyvera intermedia]
MSRRIKQPKPKICPICSTEYIPRSSLQKVCHNYKCALEFNRRVDAKNAECEKSKRDKAERAKWRERKANVKPLSHWMSMTQRAFNDYIRARDGDICISCGSTTAISYHAGHYRTTAAASQLRFNEDNVHSQCAACNVHHSGAIGPYRINLIAKIGAERVEALENNNTPHRYTREELDAIRAHYRALLRELISNRSEAA